VSRARWVLALAMFVGAEPALACKCALVPRERAIRSAQLVFQGRILKIETTPESGPADQVTTMTVIRNIKGMTRGETVKIRSHTQSASCGYDFRDAQKTLLVGGSRLAGGMLSVSRCTMYNLNR
jgi:hypothetical protein